MFKPKSIVNALKKVGSTTVKYEKAPMKEVKPVATSMRNTEYGKSMNRALGKAKDIGVGVGGK